MSRLKQILLNKGSIWRRGALTFVLAWIFQFLHAQNGNAPDTLSVQPDTVVTEASPHGEYYEDEEEGDDEEGDEKDYFLQKWMQYGEPDSLELRRLPDSAVQVLKNDKSFWYANEIFEKEKKEQKERREGSSFSSSFLNTLLWILIIGGFAAFLILFLANSHVRIFRRSRTVKTAGDAEEETEDIFAINYQKEIDKAIQEGNYRLATRLMFLRLLRNLSERNIIQYKPDRTNFDYLSQLHNTAWYESFFRIARNYEYAWYGLFDVDREKFSVIRNDFEGFENLLNRNRN